MAWILDSVCIVVQTLGLKQGLDHSSFVSFGLFVNVSSKFCFFKRGSFVLSCEAVFLSSNILPSLLLFCVILTNAFTFTSFPMNFYLSVFCCGYGAGLIKTIDRSTDLGKRLTSAVLCIPFTPSCCNLLQQKNVIESHLLAEEVCNSNQASYYTCSFSAINNIFSSTF